MIEGRKREKKKGKERENGLTFSCGEKLANFQIKKYLSKVRNMVSF